MKLTACAVQYGVADLGLWEVLVYERDQKGSGNWTRREGLSGQKNQEGVTVGPERQDNLEIGVDGPSQRSHAMKAWITRPHREKQLVHGARTVPSQIWG